MVRIAMLCPYLPAPPISGGRIRIFELAQGLAREHELVLFATSGKRELRNPDVETYLEPFSGVHVKLNPWTWFRDRKLPRRVTRSSVLATALGREHANDPFNLAIVEHSHAAKPVIDAGLPFILDEHNIESRYLAAHHAAAHRSRRMRDDEQSRYEAWEHALWRRAKTVVCVSKEDADVVREATSRTAVTVVPNGVNISSVAFRPPSQRSTSNVLFVGLMNHPPNVAAARMLVDHIMPRVWTTVPEARLVLCGHNPSPEVRRLACDRVKVTGTVPTVAGHLDEAAVIVNPLQHGAGTSLKVLEALASGAPLVTTRTGVRGYEDPIIAASLIADTAEDMATAITGCLTGQIDDARAKLGREAVAAYDWVDLSRRFNDVVAANTGIVGESDLV